jgi:hypothetical protein
MKLHMMHFDFFGRVARMQTWVVWADETASWYLVTRGRIPCDSISGPSLIHFLPTSL